MSNDVADFCLEIIERPYFEYSIYNLDYDLAADLFRLAIVQNSPLENVLYPLLVVHPEFRTAEEWHQTLTPFLPVLLSDVSEALDSLSKSGLIFKDSLPRRLTPEEISDFESEISFLSEYPDVLPLYERDLQTRLASRAVVDQLEDRLSAILECYETSEETEVFYGVSKVGSGDSSYRRNREIKPGNNFTLKVYADYRAYMNSGSFRSRFGGNSEPLRTAVVSRPQHRGRERVISECWDRESWD